MEHKPIKKIVYFDEGSAIDYLDITNGGLMASSSQNQTTNSSNIEGSVDGSLGTGILFKALSPFLNIEASSEASANISRLGESFVKTVISNTVLSDFINVVQQDKSIKIIEGCSVKAYPDSISYLKMYTPYFSMVNMDDQAINFSKVDEVLEKGKGYYELIANDNLGKDIKILRFNIKAFRNNYSLVDLTKMDLKFYAIEVGKMKIIDLDPKNEFNFMGGGDIINIDEFVTSPGSNHDISDPENNDLIVYDVILAGVSSDG